MNIVKFILYIFVILGVCYCTYILGTDYQTFSGRTHLPFILWIIDTIDLFIHEAGHLVFSLFGQILYFMGGSLFQIIVPISAAVVFGRANPKSLPFTFYWAGQSIVNVSIYIGDAPYRQLRLLSRHALHDWHFIFSRLNILDDAEMIGAIVNIVGIVVCISGIAIGLYFIGKQFRSFLIGNEA